MRSTPSSAKRIVVVFGMLVLLSGCRGVGDRMADAEHDAVTALPPGWTFLDRHVTSDSRVAHYRLTQNPDEAAAYVTAKLKADHRFRGAGDMAGAEEIGLSAPEVTTMQFYRVPAPDNGTYLEIKVRHET